MKSSNVTLMELVVWAVFFLAYVWLSGHALHFDIVYWGSWIESCPVTISMIPCYIGGLFLGSMAIPVAIFTWVVSFIM